MHKLCRQVSIESPGPVVKDCVFSFVVPVPDTPENGARVKVVYAGACYRRQKSPSISSMSSISSDLSELAQQMAGSPHSSAASPAHHGYRDGALFPGFEVAGVIEELGPGVSQNKENGFYVGQRVVLYPFDDCPNGYAEYIVVPDLKYLIPIPDSFPLSVAAMLPTGALLAMNTVFEAQEILSHLLKEREAAYAANPETSPPPLCRILIVGTGGLALWAVRIAAYHFHQLESSKKVQITVASLRDEGFMLAKDFENVNVVQWSEDLYEKQLIERTVDACGGAVDIVIDFGTTSRSLHRSIQCLSKGGVVLVSEEVGEKLLPKFSSLADKREVKLRSVADGTIEQLKQLVELVSSHEIEPPPHSVFPFDDAQEVVRKLCHSEIPGRAILKFHDIE
ncbi:zinc-type alcohol dehydrogenase-like protein C1773.06c isoform X2 [Contarinia nasturtii]|nr:zinc-type alcohol dehydrogenase-like protein C1773.06c isoform X2 [Contarinia nasturtii]XP_031638435.1 zinc-type alcohol dehydrogenase-like protein C1773.06c isoform X2 [Contarinia nasturtii]XP_031638443.1 zinc-type alcohol dehydrogenase-like protein C1773.06c isoform X2 [Contarinia nasturtii]